MIIKPKVRGFVCVTAHPEGCAASIQQQIDYVQKLPAIKDGPKNALIVGCSTGYGLSSRIALAYACNAKTTGVCFERPANNGRPASAGWYNTSAFSKAAHSSGLYAKSINGDAFSNEIKDQTIESLKNEVGPIDMFIYSLASPRRTDPSNGEIYKSVLKPVGQDFTSITVNTDKNLIENVSLERGTDQDVEATRKVMGGEDWMLWIDALENAGLLADGANSIAYSYIGPEVTWPIYKEGTIGLAKEDLEKTAFSIDDRLKARGGRAVVSINKAVVTQASSAIPVVPLYNSTLFKIMKEKGLHEGCIEQIYRLFSEKLAHTDNPVVDEQRRIRLDDWELRTDVQDAVKKIWPTISTENLYDVTDYKSYQEEFLKLFGFGFDNVDYEADTEIERPLD